MAQPTVESGQARYDVYGLGNALVDLEYAVDEAFLRDVDLAKGHMTLVDESRIDNPGSDAPRTPAQAPCRRVRGEYRVRRPKPSVGRAPTPVA